MTWYEHVLEVIGLGRYFGRFSWQRFEFCKIANPNHPISNLCSHEWCALMLIKLNCFCMYAAAPENVPRYYVLFVRVAIKQREQRNCVFSTTSLTHALLSTKTDWAQNWTLRVSTRCTNWGSFWSISPFWYCPCFDFGSERTIHQIVTFFLLKLSLQR